MAASGRRARTVRYRLMATYQGSPFEAGIGPTNADIVVFAACPPPEELGFEPATGHWRKQLRVADVQAIWESRPVGTFRGERCMVLDDLGDRLHIGYLGHDAFKAEQLGYWQVDRGVFELVAPRTDVMDILEERTDYRRPVTGPQPVSGSGSGSGSHAVVAPGTSGQYATLRKDPRSSGQYASPAASAGPDPRTSGQSPVAADFGATTAPGVADPDSPAVPDSTTGVALPAPAAAPLPLEAEAMRAASAARRPRQEPGPATSPAPMPQLQLDAAPARLRRAARRRMATERLFADLAAAAGIPADSYSVGESVDGALCLVQAGDGFEVFHSAAGARHELQVFATEEAACFYLFGVLAAEAVQNGSLARAPIPAGLGTGQPPRT